MEFKVEKERLLHKEIIPTQELISHFLGEEAMRRLALFEKMLQENYDLTRELKFPFGNSYGWAYRYTHKKALLLYAFFSKKGFCCTVSINDSGAKMMATIIDTMLPKTEELWKNRYPCGKEGGWVNYPVASDEELKDMIRLVGCKEKPKKQTNSQH